VVTEVREAEVLRASDLSVTVREAGGDTRRFTQAELGDRGIRIVRDGQPVRIAELQRGDKLTATIITNGPPAVLTEQEVQATLAESKVEPAKVELAKVEPATTQVATAANVAQPAASAGSSQPSAAPPASRPDERSGMGLTWYVAIAVLIALALIVFMRRRKRP
jgi:cytochrome oxidase assembly protein ShyY1